MANPNSADVSLDTDSLGADELSFSEFERMRDGKESGAGDELAESAVDSETTTEEEASENTKPTADAKGSEEPAKDKDEEDDADKADTPKKGKGGFQKKIDKLTREKKELEERLSRLETTVAEKPAGKVESGSAEPTGKPKDEDYENYSDFLEALTEWKLTQRDEQRQAEAAKKDREAQQQTVAKAWDAKKDAARAAVDDFDEVMDEAKEIIIPGHMQEAILDDEHGALLAYRLAKNPDEVKRIAGLSPVSAARELGKLSAAIAAELAPKTEPTPQPKPKTSRAPKPVTPVTGGTGSASRDLDDPDLSYDEWERKREAQIRGRRAR